MVETSKTFRRVPLDVEHARFIHALITKEIEGNITELTKDLAKLHKVLTWQNEWQAVVNDLSRAPEVHPGFEGKPKPAPGKPAAPPAAKTEPAK
jgi:hypothetical protein